MGTRKRVLPCIGPGANWSITRRRWDDGRTTITRESAPSYSPLYLQGTQVTVSENHPSWRRKKPSFAGDDGGPFSSRKQYATLTGANAAITGGFDLGVLYQTTRYRGLSIPTAAAISWPPFADSAESALNAAGAQAIERCKPTNIFVDLSASLGELLREGVPKMDISHWKSSVDLARKTAGNFLSLEFGFQPVLDDIKTVALSQVRANAAIQQYIRDSGKVVRRRFDFPPQESEVTTSFANGVRPFLRYSDTAITDFFTPTGEVLKTRRTSVRRWFSGAFTYHLPLDDSLEQMSANALRAQGLVNLDLTPETLWNLTPWSWAVDWLVPVGTYIGNLQDWSTDGLVMRYGYLMEHSICSDTYTYVGRNSSQVGILTLTSEVKKRIRANPFGFGLSWEGLSPRRLAILTALGINRS